MKKCLAIIATMVSLISLGQDKTYQLTGEVEGFPSGMAYVRYWHEGPVLDSGMIHKGKFEIKGKFIDYKIARVMIKRQTETQASPENITEFFLEPAFIRIEAEKDLQTPVFTGSDHQQQFSELSITLKDVRKRLSELDKAYTSAEQTGDAVKLDQVMGAYDSAYKVRQRILSDFINKHPASIVTAYKFGEFLGDESIDLEVVEPVYNRLPESIRQMEVMKKAAQRIAIARKTAPGKSALMFSQQDTAGRGISLSVFRGKYVLIDFWSSWCRPCRAENPNLRRLYSKYKQKGFEILGVSLDGDREPWIKAIIKDELTWPQVSDLKVFDNDVAVMYGIGSIPQNILIDPQGTIIAKNLRGLALQRKLALLLD